MTLSASQATWLFFRKEEDFKPEEQESLRQLRQASPDLEVTYHLVEEFLRMVRKRTGEQLDAWLNKVKASHLLAFQTFVMGVQNDKEAILVGLTLPWSTGHLWLVPDNQLPTLPGSGSCRAEFYVVHQAAAHQAAWCSWSHG